MLVLVFQALLPADEGEAFAELQEEVLELLDDRRFEVALVQPLGVGQVEEVEHVRLAERVDRALEGDSARDEVQHAGFVAALVQAGEELGVNLALQNSRAPPVPIGFDLVERARRRELDLREGAVVAPGE